MDMTEEAEKKRTIISLYRCQCKHCDVAVVELKRLAQLYGADLQINPVEKDTALKKLAGWKTPLVYVNGKMITLFTLDIRKWDEAIKKGVTEVPTVLIGEVLCMTCYMEKEEQGIPHAGCAETCIKKGGPIGLLTSEKEVYLLIEDRTIKKPYESLKEFAADRVKVTGTIVQRSGVQAVTVRTVEPLFKGMS